MQRRRFVAACGVTQRVAEQGVSGYDLSLWTVLMAETPCPIIDQLNAATLQALHVPAARKRLDDIGAEARASTPEEMKAMVLKELPKCTRVVADARIPK